MTDYQKEYYQKNRERIRQKQKEYKLKNKDKIKQYNEDNKDRLKELREEWANNNPEKIREYKRRYVAKNREKTINYHKDYNKRHYRQFKDDLDEFIQNQFKIEYRRPYESIDALSKSERFFVDNLKAEFKKLWKFDKDR